VQPREDEGGKQADGQREGRHKQDGGPAIELLPAGADRGEERDGRAGNSEVGTGCEVDREVLERALEDADALETCRVYKREMEQGASGTRQQQACLQLRAQERNAGSENQRDRRERCSRSVDPRPAVERGTAE